MQGNARAVTRVHCAHARSMRCRLALPACVLLRRHYGTNVVLPWILNLLSEGQNLQAISVCPGSAGKTCWDFRLGEAPGSE